MLLSCKVDVAAFRGGMILSTATSTSSEASRVAFTREPDERIGLDSLMSTTCCALIDVLYLALVELFLLCWSDLNLAVISSSISRVLYTT